MLEFTVDLSPLASLSGTIIIEKSNQFNITRDIKIIREIYRVRRTDHWCDVSGEDCPLLPVHVVSKLSVIVFT